MNLLDVHAHLDYYKTEEEQDSIIENCKKNNVTVITQGTTIESNRKVLELAKKYNFIKPALGVYPTHCIEYEEKQMNGEFDFIRKHNPTAIGEVGLDYKEVKNELLIKRMKKCFEEFIEISRQKNIPIIVHSRNAELDTIEILEQFDHKKIIMHCFSGRKHHIKRIIENGWSFSIPCNIIKLEHFQNIVKQQELTKIFTETDSPFLSPYPKKKNEPSFVIESLKKIAEIKKLSIEETANIIYNNYQRMFL
ncbi:MAG: TatD family hydrolase [Candidatus Woesearchaeota archaeon]